MGVRKRQLVMHCPSCVHTLRHAAQVSCKVAPKSGPSKDSKPGLVEPIWVEKLSIRSRCVSCPTTRLWATRPTPVIGSSP
ncbi:uncharacterized protein N7515_010374 [Penicillium bovifimosum]|uniref:Uncharacterized protein n=1 Tax=Penicillium bovifimosum TaxID=126998 RepID=A0A9W9KSE0_9EURO|nr:uncharacterized protein N7515_010374 [Penicillium bovifimosum]KAJ5118151.1 hypothetical protein N7515_010374 [Penicillium bovifimosum]